MIDSLLAFLVMIFRYEVGTIGFYLSVGGTLVAILVVARLFAGLFGSSKGIFMAGFAALLPLLLGALGYVAVELYALPQIKANWATAYLPWTAFIVLWLLVALFVSSKLWKIGGVSALVALVLAVLAGLAAQYTAQLVIKVIDSGTSQVEKRDERFNLDIE